MKHYTEAQIREALDGKFMAYSVAFGRFEQVKVPLEFDPCTPEGERLLQKIRHTKVPGD